MMRVASACVALAALCGALAGCGGGELDGPRAGAGGAGGGSAGEQGGAAGSGAEPTTFIALERDFAGYRKWTSFYMGEGDPETDDILGPRTVYINQLPKPGATKFPVGTIIVKAVQVGEPAEWQLFAMVKRGGDYNFLGARDWEFFDMAQDAAYVPTVNWRGIGPPPGAGYGGSIKGGTCNNCHGMAEDNDFVKSAPLDLTPLSRPSSRPSSRPEPIPDNGPQPRRATKPFVTVPPPHSGQGAPCCVHPSRI